MANDWLVSEEKAAKEAGMDAENYQVRVEQVVEPGCYGGKNSLRSQQRKKPLKTICFKMALKMPVWEAKKHDDNI